MLRSELNIDSINKMISDISLVKSVNKELYDDQFNLHLTSLLEFVEFDTVEAKENFKFTETNYFGLEQRILESRDLCDEDAYDMIDEARYLYKNKLKKLLGKEGDSNHLKPFILFSTDIFESWLTYSYLNESKHNPWTSIARTITSSGCLLFVSSDRYKLEDYKKGIYERVDDECYGNLGIVAKPNIGGGRSSGFIVDNRFSSQIVVKDYLEKAARGWNNAKPIDKIKDFVERRTKRSIPEKYLRSNILLPLKRQNLIGSNASGFFFISSVEDVVSSYKHHLNSLKGIQKTIDNCKLKAKEFGVDDLDSLV